MRSLLLLALLPAAARAESLAETHFLLNFCYSGAFDAAHLREHPEQEVRSIRLGREPAGTLEKLGELPLEVEVTLADGGRELEALARCRPEAEGLRCSLGRDAGGFGLEAQGDGIALTAGPEGMVFESWSEEVRIGAGEDGADRSFLLRRCG